MIYKNKKQSYSICIVVSLICVQLCAGVLPANADLSQNIQSICKWIEQGQFEKAGQALHSMDNSDPNVVWLKNTVDKYQDYSSKLFRQRQEVYQAQKKKLDDMFSKNDPNRKDTAVLDVILKIHEYSDDKQKAELLKDKAVAEFLGKVRQKCISLYESNEGSKAVTEGLGYLSILDPNDKVLDDIIENVGQSVSIAYAWTKTPCRDAGRFEKIQPRVFLDAVEVLDSAYVAAPDYRLMLEKSLKRCSGFTETLKKDSAKMMFTGDPNQFNAWESGIRSLSEKLFSDKNPTDRKYFEKVFTSVLSLNESTLKLPAGAVVEQFTEGSLDALDPYTELIWPDYVVEFNKEITGKFSGVGIRLAKEGKYIKAVSIIPDSPAARSDVLADDLITAIDGQTTEGVALDCAVKQITGTKGTKVTLSIKRDDAAAKDIVLTRDDILVPAMQGSGKSKDNIAQQWDYMLDPNDRIGYIQLQTFTQDVSKQALSILENLEKQGLSGLILDFRGNGGGLLSEAADLASLFVERGVIVFSRDRKQRPSIWTANGNGKNRNYPIVILTDNGTASASEIVAGALSCQLYNRAILVGDRTYGKGTVQELVEGKWNGAELKFTTAYYYLPDGSPVKNRFQLKRQNRTDWGIQPQVEIQLRSDEIKKVSDILRSIRDHSASAASTSEWLTADPQLATGVIVLKASMMRQGWIYPRSVLPVTVPGSQHSDPNTPARTTVWKSHCLN